MYLPGHVPGIAIDAETTDIEMTETETEKEGGMTETGAGRGEGPEAGPDPGIGEDRMRHLLSTK